jgi:hypothetical protein
MRTLPSRPGLRSATQKRLQGQTDAIVASSNPQEGAEKRYTNARKSRWFGEVLSKLKSMAGPGEPCMLCDGNEATEVEHYRPKSVFPDRALQWENLLWGDHRYSDYSEERRGVPAALGRFQRLIQMF